MRRPGEGVPGRRTSSTRPSGRRPRTWSLRAARRALDAFRCVREQLTKDVPEEVERDDDGDREEAEQNRVLGRRLAILALPQLGDSDLQPNPRTHQDVGHVEVPPPVRGAQSAPLRLPIARLTQWAYSGSVRVSLPATGRLTGSD